MPQKLGEFKWSVWRYAADLPITQLIVIHIKVKDVRVPEQLMRAMAAEAEAARDARAKVILRKKHLKI